MIIIQSLAEANDATSDATTGIARSFAQWDATFAQIVGIGVNLMK